MSRCHRPDRRPARTIAVLVLVWLLLQLAGHFGAIAPAALDSTFGAFTVLAAVAFGSRCNLASLRRASRAR